MPTLTYNVPGLPIILRRKLEGRVWTARIKFTTKGKDFGRIERSTGKRDLDGAIKAAHRLYAGLTISFQNNGGLESGKTFAVVSEEFIAEAAKQCRDGKMKKSRFERDKITLRRHLMPSLGKLPINQIRNSVPAPQANSALEHEAKDLTDYIDKRTMNRHRPVGADEITFQRGAKTLRYKRLETPPSPATLRRERQSFAAVMQFAKKRHYVRSEDIPVFPAIEGPSGRRRCFSRDQMELLQNVSIARILAAKHPLRRRQRLMCHLRMMWIYLTGCRPQEIAHLRFRNIIAGVDVNGGHSFRLELEDAFLKHPAHKRVVVPLPGFNELFFDSVFDEIGYDDDDYIFTGPDRRPLGNSNKMFRRLLRAAALDEDAARLDRRINERNPFYSLRHTFITERLYEGMEIGRLARWCGTSVAMIERYYAHIRSEIEMSPGEPKPFDPVVIPLPTEAKKGVLDFRPDLRFPMEDDPLAAEACLD